MSPADRPTKNTRRRRKGQRGFTILEVAVTLSLVTVMALIVERTLDSTRKAENMLSAVRKATERGQKLTYEIRELVTASRRLFFAGDEGQGFLEACDLSRAPLFPGTRMPVVQELARLGPDEVGSPRTGNILFFVSEADATPAIADPIGPSIRYIDTYRFVCCYPRLSTRSVVIEDGLPAAFDMVVWQSVEFPNYKQLMAISDPTERSNVVADLVDTHGHTMAWDPTGEVDTSFYGLDSSGNIAGAPSPGPTIDEDLDESDGGRLVYANIQLSRSDNSDMRRRAVFSMDNPDDWKPNGFEVKVVGSSGSRKVWMHLVVEVQADKGRVAVQPNTIIVGVQDM